MSQKLLPSTILKRARDIVAEGPWCKGAEKDNKDRFCAVGATAEASGCTWTPVYEDEKYDPRTMEFIKVEPFLVSYDRSVKSDEAHDADDYLDRATSLLYGAKYVVGSVISMNDRKATRRSQMVRIFDLAIQMAERDEKDEKNRKVRLARAAARRRSLVSA